MIPKDLSWYPETVAVLPFIRETFVVDYGMLSSEWDIHIIPLLLRLQSYDKSKFE